MVKLKADKQFAVTEEKLKQILKSWRIHNFTHTLPKAGKENITVFINADDEEYVLRVYRNEGIDFINTIEKEIRFINYLSSKKIKVPEIINTNKSELINTTTIDGITWYSILMKKIDGQTPEKYTPGLIKDIANELAKIHLASLQYDVQDEPFFDREDEFDRVEFESISDKKTRDLISRAKSFKLDTDLNLPKGLIHNDITRVNLMEKEGKLKAILDFEGIKHSYLVNDIGVVLWGLIRNISTGKLSKDVIHTFLDTYSNIRPLTVDERKHLKQSIKFRNYQLAYMDYVLGDVTDEIEMEKLIDEFDIILP